MGAYTLLQDLTTTTTTNSIVMNNFGTITKDDFIKIVVTTVSTGSRVEAQLFTNSSTTASNYRLQQIIATGSTISTSRQSNAVATDTGTNQTSVTIIYYKLSENNRANFFANTTFTTDSGLFIGFNYVTSNVDVGSTVTTLTLQSGASNIAAGTRIQIYRLDAVKVADITVASNTTQVDISNLSIDKDSEYLLVSDVITAGGGSSLFIFPNDLSTATQYFTQFIIADGSSTIIGRANQPFAWFNPASQRVLGHSHIKLSNIGAYTSQNYSIQGYGITTPVLRSHFISSTYENLTSITKISLTLPTSIATGSTFVLYKLYE